MEIIETNRISSIFIDNKDLGDMISLNISKNPKIKLSANVFNHTKAGKVKFGFSNGAHYEGEVDVSDYMGSPVKLYGPREFLKEFCRSRPQHYIMMEKI